MDRVLLLDDYHGLLVATRMLLEQHGYEVLATPDPFKAKEMVYDESKPVDIALIDWKMPLMGGDVFISDIRKSPPKNYLVMILHSAREAHELQPIVKSCGAHGFIVKPCIDLAQRVADILENARRERSIYSRRTI